MSSILDWGVNVVLWFQQFSPALDLPFLALTFVGGIEFLLLLVPFVYWCVDRRTGAYLAILVPLSGYANQVVKALAGQPRPFQYTSQVRPLSTASGGGFPSGHTQLTVTTWGYLCAQLKRRWLWVLGGALGVLVPLSRIYLGVHFPHDVLGGLVLGVAFVLLCLWVGLRVQTWLVDIGLLWQLGLAICLPILMLVSLSTDESTVAAAMLIGLGTGFALERRWVGFASSGPLWQRALRFLLGMAGLAGLYLGLRGAFSGLEPTIVFRCLRYALVGLWCAVGAPWAFVRLRLAGTASSRSL